MNRETNRLLALGAIAGPIYIIIGALEMMLRPGYDIRRHELSVVANGEYGWIHIAMMATTGLLTVVGAVGLRRAIRGQIAGRWAPILIGLYGAGVICAAFFTADPTMGFPPGTPANAHSVTWHGSLHLMFGSLGFLGLIAAALVLARRFRSTAQRGLMTFSIITGVLFLLSSFSGIVAGGGGTNENPDALAATLFAFTGAVAVAWTWLTTIFITQRHTLPAAPVGTEQAVTSGA